MTNVEENIVQDLPEMVARNIASIEQWKAQRRSREKLSDRVASSISRFAGSMPFVYAHLVLFGGWIISNLGWIDALPQWDPSLVILAMFASVEAIFLSTFVLINQNRTALEADERAELDLQVSLLNEQETTRLIVMVQAIANHLGVPTGVEQDLADIAQETQPNAILDAVKAERDEPGIER